MLGKRDQPEETTPNSENTNAKISNPDKTENKPTVNLKAVKTQQNPANPNSAPTYVMKDPVVVGLNRDDKEDYKGESEDSDFNSQDIEDDGELSSVHSSVDEDTLKEFQEFIKRQRNGTLADAATQNASVKEEQKKTENNSDNPTLENNQQSQTKPKPQA